jgi:chemotaxis protein CheX
MHPNMLNPFVLAALHVLRAELGEDIQRGMLQSDDGKACQHDIMVAFGITGAVEGTVIYGMDQASALQIVGVMMGQACNELDEMVESAIGELGNMITGHASKELSKVGYKCNITPPLVIYGDMTTVRMPSYKRIAIPVVTHCGTILIHLALSQS